MKKFDIASFLLRIVLSAGFLSAVASRLSLWGNRSSGWQAFLDYTGQVNSFTPKSLIAPKAFTSTILETCFGVMLLVGFKTRYAAYGAAILTLFFTLAMAYSFGIKEPLDYSVLAFSAGSFMLATLPRFRWSVDELLVNKS